MNTNVNYDLPRLRSLLPRSQRERCRSPRGRRGRWAHAHLVLPLFVCLALTHVSFAADSESPASTEGRALLIDDQLVSRPIVLVSLDERLLTYTDEQQRRRTLSRSNILALIPEQTFDRVPRRNSPTTTPGVLELVDGQRFPGDLLPTGGDDESIAWTHPSLGQMTFPLERALAFWRPGTPLSVRSAPPDGPTRADTLLLTNGDQLTGFLATIGDPVTIESDAGPTDLPPERILGARLSNAPEDPVGARLWLDDGTVVRVDKVIIDSGLRASFSAENAAAGSASWSQLRAVALDAGRLRPLSRIRPASHSPARERRYAPPIVALADDQTSDPSELRLAPLDADDLLLPGPMTVNWVLPESARRIAFSASLADGAAPWGDCELIISIEGVEQARHRLTPDSAAIAISVPIASGRAMSVTVEPGRYGPIRDWVVLSRPLILLAAPRRDSSE